MSAVNAWLLDLGGGLYAAVGELDLVHLLPDTPTLFEIPRSPTYCRKVLVWRDAILPLMDLAARLLSVRPVAANPAEGSDDPIAIGAFQAHPGAAPRHGALLLRGLPERVPVRDSDACDLPESLQAWRPWAISCFQHPHIGPVPVLDLNRVFSLPWNRHTSALPARTW